MKKKSKKNKTYCLLCYVDDASSKLKRFDTPKEMGAFIDAFFKLHPQYLSEDSDFWVDYAITDISGDVHFFTDGLAVE